MVGRDTEQGPLRLELHGEAELESEDGRVLDNDAQ